MSGLTILETIFIWYVIVVNVLGLINIIFFEITSRKVREISLYIMISIAIPIVIPFVLFFDFYNIIKSKRKKDLEKKFDEFFNNKGEENDNSISTKR